MRASDLVLLALLFLTALADSALTYAIIVSGVGYEANPAWAAFNYEPKAVWTVGLPMDAIAVLLTATLLAAAYMSRLPTAVKIVRIAMIIMAASRGIVVLNNTTVLLAHTTLIPTWLFP